LLHNGNIASANSSSIEANHNQYFTLMQSIGYDAVTLGNKDMNKNGLFSSELKSQSSFTLIDTVESSDLISNRILPFQIVKKSSLKIGIIANPATQNIFPKSLTTKAGALSKTAAYLKDNHQCNLVICLSTGNEAGSNSKAIKNDIEMAALTTNIDVIISGNNAVERPLNQVCRNAKKEEVFIHTSSHDGSAVGRIDIVFNDELKKRSIKGFYREGKALC
jgi:5'-nucleotidase